jgi:hypothetical protein
VHHPEHGHPISVSDGHWVVTYSLRGTWGFLAVFVLIAWPLVVLRKRLRRVDDPAQRVMLGGLGLIATSAALDLIPNALNGPLTIFLAGALYGAARGLSAPPPSDEGPVLGSPASGGAVEGP